MDAKLAWNQVLFRNPAGTLICLLHFFDDNYKLDVTNAICQFGNVFARMSSLIRSKSVKHGDIRPSIGDIFQLPAPNLFGLGI